MKWGKVDEPINQNISTLLNGILNLTYPMTTMTARLAIALFIT